MSLNCKKTLFLMATLLSIHFSLKAQNGPYDICPIKNSEQVPTAEVYDQKGAAVDIQTYIAERKVVLVFYRGGWCPYCMKHLSALQAAKSEINGLGYELIAITPDDFSHLDSSRTNAAFDYTLFSDKAVNAIQAFGIGWKVTDGTYTKYKEKYGIDLEFWSDNPHHVLPVPAVFVIREGKIQYQHVDPNYSQQLSPTILTAFLKE